MKREKKRTLALTIQSPNKAIASKRNQRKHIFVRSSAPAPATTIQYRIDCRSQQRCTVYRNASCIRRKRATIHMRENPRSWNERELSIKSERVREHVGDLLDEQQFDRFAFCSARARTHTVHSTPRIHMHTILVHWMSSHTAVAHTDAQHLNDYPMAMYSICMRMQSDACR